MKFEKANFTVSGEWVHYEGNFIARIRSKHTGPFITFLTKNFNVDEYLARLVTGEAPLTILESKGYISPNFKKVLKSYNLPCTPDGVKQYRELMRKECE